MHQVLKIADRDIVLEISYEDLIKYHGRLHIGGVALAFKILELGFASLAPEVVPRRGKFSFFSGLGEEATGVLDGVEMVTRARSRGCMKASLTVPGHIEAPALSNGAKFYFELGYEGKKIGLALKKGIIPDEFMLLAAKSPLNQEEKKHLQELKEELAATLMSHEAAELFDCLSLQK